MILGHLKRTFLNFTRVYWKRGAPVVKIRVIKSSAKGRGYFSVVYLDASFKAGNRLKRMVFQRRKIKGKRTCFARRGHDESNHVASSPYPPPFHASLLPPGSPFLLPFALEDDVTQRWWSFDKIGVKV